MKSIKGIGLKDVKKVYGGAEGDLWELVMGQQIHIGGFASSMALAEKAGIGKGSKGIDLCCCSGAGMRFLVKIRGVESMIGVDATGTVVRRGRKRCKNEGYGEKIVFVQKNVCNTGLPDGAADFVWGEDAWCYVENKAKLIAESVRLVRSGGTIAFTDWVEGPVNMSEPDAERYMKFMKFPNILSIGDYSDLLRKNDCEVLIAEDTKQFAPHVDLYLNMLNMQLTYDALKIIDFDMNLMGAMGAEMVFMQKLAHDGMIAQGRFVAKKK